MRHPTDAPAPLDADHRRPRMLLKAARWAARQAAFCTEAAPIEQGALAGLIALESTMEDLRRHQPHAWRAAAHVRVLAQLTALRRRLRDQAKASGSEALRSATKAARASLIEGSSGGA